MVLLISKAWSVRSSTELGDYVVPSSMLTPQMASLRGAAVLSPDFPRSEAEPAFPVSQPIYSPTRVAAYIKFNFSGVVIEV